MNQSALKSFGEKSEYKNLYCDTCNSLIPPPGFFVSNAGLLMALLQLPKGSLPF